MAYKCVFFDLDHTLWDYEANCKETLSELYQYYDLQNHGIIDFELFYLKFREVNQNLWLLYDTGKISSEVIRNERFKQIFQAFGAHEASLTEQVSVDYLHACPKKKALMPGAIETLDYLSSHYTLTIVTNGFEEIQHAKLTSGSLLHYFDHVVTSQTAGYKKPAREIFDFALNLNSISAGEAVMVGDNLINDVVGARNADIDTAFFNPEELDHKESVIYEIKKLTELCDIL